MTTIQIWVLIVLIATNFFTIWITIGLINLGFYICEKIKKHAKDKKNKFRGD